MKLTISQAKEKAKSVLSKFVKAVKVNRKTGNVTKIVVD